MIDRISDAEQNRAIASVSRCHMVLWHAREEARRVDDMLRRAIRTVEDAEDALNEAARRLNRFDATPASSHPRDGRSPILLLR